MKNALSILILCALPILASASGDHAGGHDIAGMEHGMGEEAHDTMAGKPGDPAQVSRTIDITMDDTMRYTPSEINVKTGETVRFFIKNQGKMSHEMVIGSMDELKEHAEMMRNMPNMKHVEANMITLAPGQRGGLVWQFNKAGTVDFACLVPGHMEAGMSGKVEVE